MRMSDWSSDVCSSDRLLEQHFTGILANSPASSCHFLDFDGLRAWYVTFWSIHRDDELAGCGALKMLDTKHGEIKSMPTAEAFLRPRVAAHILDYIIDAARARSEEHTSALQSLMRISSAVFCLTKKQQQKPA